jgi:hypothetical protein
LSPWQIWGPEGNIQCDFGVCGSTGPFGFGPGALALPAAEGLGGLVCFGSGACEVALTVAGAIGAGVVLYKGIEAGVQIYQARSEDRLLNYIARKYCVDRHQLGDAVEEEKRMSGRGPKDNLSRQEIEEIAKMLPKIPGCMPQP